MKIIFVSHGIKVVLLKYIYIVTSYSNKLERPSKNLSKLFLNKDLHNLLIITK